MKNLFFFLLVVITFSISAQTTYVPDDNFEQYLISNGYDDVASYNSNITDIDVASALVLDEDECNSLSLKSFNTSINVSVYSNPTSTFSTKYENVEVDDFCI